MRDPHVRFCERRGGVISRAYSTAAGPCTPVCTLSLTVASTPTRSARSRAAKIRIQRLTGNTVSTAIAIQPNKETRPAERQRTCNA